MCTVAVPLGPMIYRPALQTAPPLSTSIPSEESRGARGHHVEADECSHPSSDTHVQPSSPEEPNEEAKRARTLLGEFDRSRALVIYGCSGGLLTSITGAVMRSAVASSVRRAAK